MRVRPTPHGAMWKGVQPRARARAIHASRHVTDVRTGAPTRAHSAAAVLVRTHVNTCACVVCVGWGQTETQRQSAKCKIKRRTRYSTAVGCRNCEFLFSARAGARRRLWSKDKHKVRPGTPGRPSALSLRRHRQCITGRCGDSDSTPCTERAARPVTRHSLFEWACLLDGDSDWCRRPLHMVRPHICSAVVHI